MYVVGWVQVVVSLFFFLEENEKLLLEMQPESFSVITKKPVNFIDNPTDNIWSNTVCLVFFCVFV